jgi:arginyl-tRNA synthetase
MAGETSKKYLLKLLERSANELGFNLDGVKFEITRPEPQFGDYATNAALVLSRQLKRSPQEIAAIWADKAKELDYESLLDSAAAAGGFINFKLADKYLLQNLQAIIDQRDLYGASIAGGGKKVLVEYFQPNIAKPLHLGHLRTAIIGDSLFRVLLSQGFKTESDTHLGDWGTQFGLLLYAFKKYGDLLKIEKNPIEELNKLYVKINAEAEQDESVREKGKAEFVKLEQGDGENRKLWKQFKEWSWKEFEIIYADLDVRRADHDWPESFFEDKMPAVIEQLKSKGLLKESQGAQIVDLEQYNLGIALVVKSDGGTTYLLRDLATYIYRKSQGFERQLYVVDVRQKHALAQTFKILELLGHITTPDEAVHIAYGFLTLPEGAMSTRKGTIISAKEFIEQVQEQAKAIIEEKNPELKNKDKIAKIVAAGAIKYFDLSHNLSSDIVFDAKKAISFQGNTGPYLQYTHARIHGILRKASQSVVQGNALLFGQADGLHYNGHETDVLRKLIQFPEIVEQAAKDFLPNLLCNYLFELSQSFNAFYQEVPVLQEPDEKIKDLRLRLITATAQVIKNGLYLLGVEAPEEM